MRSPEINDYVELKKSINPNYYDSFSISSDDFFNMIQYDENNDESEYETNSTAETTQSLSSIKSTNVNRNNNNDQTKIDE